MRNKLESKRGIARGGRAGFGLFSGALLLFAFYLLSIFRASAFTGPAQTVGTGAGAIGVDAANNLSIGTSTTQSDTRLTIVASSTASNAYSLRITQPNLTPIIVVRNDGLVGIATNSPAYALDVLGDIRASGLLFGTFAGSINPASIFSGKFASSTGGGNFSFPASLGIATSSNISLPQPLSVYGNAYVSGNVGFGVISPTHKIELAASTLPAGGIAFGDVELYRDTANRLAIAGGDSFNIPNGSLQIGTLPVITSVWQHLGTGVAGGPGFAFISDTNTGLYSSAADVVGLSTGGVARLTVNASGNVGIGTSFPSSTLHVIGSAIVTGNVTTTNLVISGISGLTQCLRVNSLGVVSGAGVDCGSGGGGGVTTSTLPTVNALPLWTVQNPAQIGNSVISQSGSNIGIGTTGPSQKLEVVGSVSSSAVCLGGTCNSNWPAGGGVATSSPVTLNKIPLWSNVNPSTLSDSVIAQSGSNVGIGTTGPGALLHISGNSGSAVPGIRIQDTGVSPRTWTVGVITVANGLNIRDETAAASRVFIDLAGNVGVGTTGPGARLHVADSGYTGSVLMNITADDAGPWALNFRQDTALQDWGVFVNNDDTLNFYDRTDGRYALTLDGSGNVGIGNATPGYKLDVSGTGRFTGDVTVGDGLGTDLTVGGGTGKLNAGVWDPIYTIGGKQYATYASAMTGIKEETTGLARLAQMADGKWQMAIDFNKAEEESDLWLFAKTTNLKENFDKLVALLTPAFDGRVWYEKDSRNLRLKIFAAPDTRYRIPDTGLEVSYRLTAPRFDYLKWTNVADGTSQGYNLDEFYGGR